MTVAALFVQPDGCYAGLDSVDPWPESRDARLYRGPHPVVSHPPCQLWGAMAAVNYARYGGEHNRPGNDGGCFASALESVQLWGGIIEHPAKSKAFSAHGIDRPTGTGWGETFDGVAGPGWICEVWQSAYGHRADKKTWIFYYSPYGTEPFDLDWTKKRGTHQIGWHGCTPKARSRPTLSKREANATPPAFRDVLLQLAKWSVTQS